MFVDIVAFSTRAEMLSGESVLTELNQFFGLIVPIIESNGGHANKLLGDGLMAVFGTPIRHTDHADRALVAAHEIQTAMHNRYGSSMRVGIGINTGRAVVGTTGGGQKLDFTVIGDVVNVASRVEAMTRDTGDAILLTEATKLALTGPAGALASRGSAQIKGRAEPASLYALVSRIPA
jgi:adenylate cyclase